MKWWQWLLAGVGLAASLALMGWGDMHVFPVETPDEVSCKVVQFNASDAHPACAIECSWGQGKRGFASSTNVPCSEWFGKEVHRQ
jgi:hypothetical protein